MASLRHLHVGLPHNGGLPSVTSRKTRQPCNVVCISRREPNPLSFASAPGTPPNLKTPYQRVADCLVFAPTRPTPKALIHFIGGAFIGAIPEVTYRLFVELLTQQDFLVIATPYNVTFEHAIAAHEVHRKFQSCRTILVDDGFSRLGIGPAEIEGLPVFSIGHSNGALLQLLIGCLVPKDLPKANAVIAFNNKPAADAIPYFEQVGPITAQLNSNLSAQAFLNLSRSFPGDYLEALLQAASPIVPVYDDETMQSLRKFTEQVPSVINQINRGLSEFTPAPMENRKTIGVNYNVQDTLLVKYKDDPIDESDIVEEVLRSRIEKLDGRLSKLTLSGNHITPCVQDMKWKVGKSYTPADAVGQLFRSVALSDIRETVTTVTKWLEMRL